MTRESQTARIYRQPKSAMQSGRAGTETWLLEFVARAVTRIDPLTGWPGSGETQSQVHLRFPTREAAIAHAEANDYAYEVEARPVVRADIKPKAYADNFKFGRTDNWTH